MTTYRSTKAETSSVPRSTTVIDTTPELVKGVTQALGLSNSPLNGGLGIVIVVLVAVAVLLIVLVIVFTLVARHSSRADKYFIGTGSSSARSDMESVTPPLATTL